ncbi:MAG: OmpH family outer membrane protein [Archangium sp.]
MSFKSVVSAFVLVASAAHAAEFKAAYVDIQRAVQEVDEGKAAKNRLQSLADGKQKATMDDKVAAAKEMDLQKKTYEFAQKAEKLRTELAESERKELGTIFPKLETLLGQIAQREGLTMVFDRSSSGLAWAPPSLDLTNELIRMYNQQYKGAGGAAKKDAPAAPAPKP